MWNSKKAVGVRQKNTHEENTKICIGFSSHILLNIFGHFKIKRKGAESIERERHADVQQP